MPNRIRWRLRKQKNAREAGRPNTPLIIGNGTVQYEHMQKQWPCLICNYSRRKYEWRRVLNHPNAKRNIHYINRHNKPDPRGMHIENKTTSRFKWKLTTRESI